MLRLAVATEAETFERLQEPLAERDILVESVTIEEDVTPIPPDAAGTDAANSDSERSATASLDLDAFDVGFVFPPRLAEGGVTDALLDVPWVNGREAVLRSRFKGETLARLDAAGLPIPDSTVVSNPVDDTTLRSVFERFDPPVVVKPNSTTRGTGVAKAYDLDSFLGICDYLDLVHDYRATGDKSFLVQEFLPDARDVRAMVVDGTYVGAVERELPASDGDRWKHNVHRGATATGIALPEGQRRLVESVAETVDISWLGVDLLVTEEGTLVTETNARPTIDSATKYESGFWDNLAALVRRRADV